MKKKWISILFVAVAIGLGVISWLLLPDVVAVQVGIDGKISNTLPKVLAVAIPFGVSVVGSVMNLTGKEETNKKAKLSISKGAKIKFTPDIAFNPDLFINNAGIRKKSKINTIGELLK